MADIQNRKHEYESETGIGKTDDVDKKQTKTSGC